MMAKRNRLFYWQVVTLSLMMLGYSGYYLCRSNFSVALPMIAGELAAHGFSPAIARIRLGAIASLGVAAYAIGKFPAGAFSDYLGGRRTFLGGMLGSVLCILLFALGAGCRYSRWPGSAIVWCNRWGWRGS